MRISDQLSIVVDRFPALFKHATIQSRQISCGPARTINAVIIPLTGTESQIEANCPAAMYRVRKEI